MTDGIFAYFTAVTFVSRGFREEILFSPHGDAWQSFFTPGFYENPKKSVTTPAPPKDSKSPWFLT